MKRLLLSLSVLLTFVSVALGDAAYDAQVIQILQSPTFPQDDVKRMLFSASFPEGYAPGSIVYSLYNPRRDRSIQGIVINIATKDASTGEKQSVDVFINVNCGPLQCVDGHESDAALAILSKSTPVLTLKEVHYLKPEGETPASVDAPASAENQSATTFVRLLSSGSVEFNGSATTLPELPTRLKALAESPENAAIVLKVDKDVPYTQVTKVLDLFREAGINHVSFTTAASANGGK